MDASKLINSVASYLSLYDCDQLYTDNGVNVDNDDIILHMHNYYLSTNDYEENRYCTPKHSPHNHFEFYYVAP